MGYTTIILVSACVFALVNSLPIAQDPGPQSQALDHLVMVEDINVNTGPRGRRTVGVLRQFFPQFTEMIDKKVNMIFAEVVKALGPTVLKGFLGGGALGGGGGGTKNNNEGSTVTVASPFDDDDDDDVDDNDDDKTDEADKIIVQLPTNLPGNEISSTDTAATQSSRSRRDLRQQLEQEAVAEGSENNEVRTTLEDNQTANEAVESELTPLSDIELGDDESRNKRLAGGSGSGAGLGSFISDILKNVLGASISVPSSTSQGAAAAPEEPVPGPATRFLVIANRGISNLIQDLILRIAATSERFVNFKARLITSII